MIWLKLAVLLGLWLVVPASAAWIAKRGPAWRRGLIALLVFSFCWQPLMTFAYQHGTKYNVRGWEFGFPEMIAAGLLAVSVEARHVLRWLSPVVLLWLLHLVVLGAATAAGISSEISAWYDWRMLRGTFVLLALMMALRERRDFEALVIGLALTALWNEWQVLRQKYGFGVDQARGAFEHQNMMGMYMILVGAVLFNVWIFRAASTRIRWSLFISFVACTHAIFAGLSRGSMFFFAVTIGASGFSALALSPDRHKLRALVLLSGVVLVGAVFMAPTVIARFNERGTAVSERTREVMNMVAEQMHEDSPLLGIGPNNYALAVNHQRYARTFDILDRERGMRTPQDIRRGQVESLYHGIRAEAGTLGFVTLLAFMASTLVLLAFKAVMSREPLTRALALAGFWGMGANYVQCTLEHTLLHAQNLYLWLTLVAVAIALPRGALSASATTLAETSRVSADEPTSAPRLAPTGPGFWT